MDKIVSIIIPVRNGESTIEKCISSLKTLHYPEERLEIIVIDDGSQDNTLTILKRIKGIKILQASGIGPSGARNIGIKEAKGTFVAFTDADCIVDKEWINELLKCFTSEDIAGVGGNQLSPEDALPLERKVHLFLKAMGFLGGYTKCIKGITEVNHNPTCNSMYRKSIFSTAGYFDERLWPGEDIDMDYRIRKAGFKIIYNPDAIVYHYRPKSFIEFARMMYRYGKTSGGYLTGKIGFYRVLSYEPIFLSVYLFLTILLFFINIWWGVFSVVAAFFAVLLLLAVRGGIKYLTINLILFLITIKFWNIGFIKGILEYRKNLKNRKN